MSLRDHSGNELVRLPGVWEILAKFAFAASVPVLLLGVSWAVWITNTVWSHTTEIAVLRASRHNGNGNVSQNVNVGESTAAMSEAERAEEEAQTRGYYLTADIARRFGKSPRTITDWINTDRFEPAPVQEGREFRFDLHVREKPLTAANSSIQR